MEGFFGGGGGDPFAGFGGGGFGGGGFGGHPGMRGRGGPPADTTAYYKTLGVEKSASGGDIKRAYRKLCMTHHPDKGGEEEKFKEIQEAFDTLKDEQKRELYNQGGKEAVEGRGQMRSSRASGGKKGKKVAHTLKVTLDELYNGSVRKLRLGREVIDKEKGVTKCAQCGGRGAVIRTVRMGPMIQQIQQPCGSCGGQGFQYSKSRVKEVIEVHVPKGANDGHKLIFYEKGDDIPDGDAGDVHILLEEQPHKEFKRHGADLYIKRKISLMEALCGFEMEIEHMDKRKIIIRSTPGEVCRPVSYDPFKDDEEDSKEFECIDNSTCDLEPMARADLDDVKKLQQVITKGQLKGKGVVAFAVANGSTVFFKASREEVMENQRTQRGSSLYVVADEAGGASGRFMKCVEGEGLPSAHNPMIAGNLFLMLEIDFPSELGDGAIAALKDVLPAPLNKVTWDEGGDGVEVHMAKDMDPVASYKANAFDAEGATGGDDDEEGPDGQRVQCAQQ